MATQTVINTSNAPGAIGPYCQARLIRNPSETLYTSGCVAIDPTGAPNPVEVKDQAILALRNLEAILTEAGFTKNDVVRVGLFLADMGDFQAVNEVYAEFFGDHKPCRTCVQAGKLPGTFRVELDAIAVH
jgi:2-iminobutanoate/2-iminopropanoate deaminase